MYYTKAISLSVNVSVNCCCIILATLLFLIACSVATLVIPSHSGAAFTTEFPRLNKKGVCCQCNYIIFKLNFSLLFYVFMFYLGFYAFFLFLAKVILSLFESHKLFISTYQI